MQTWVKRASSDTVCRLEGCERDWTTGEMMVVAKAGSEVMTFHPECWLASAQVWLEETGGESQPGRQKLDIGDEDRVKRLSLLRRRAANEQRIAEYRQRWEDSGRRDEKLRLMVMRLILVQEQLRGEIEKVGGVPKTWVGAGERLKEMLLSPAA